MLPGGFTTNLLDAQLLDLFDQGPPHAGAHPKGTGHKSRLFQKGNIRSLTWNPKRSIVCKGSYFGKWTPPSLFPCECLSGAAPKIVGSSWLAFTPTPNWGTSKTRRAMTRPNGALCGFHVFLRGPTRPHRFLFPGVRATPRHRPQRGLRHGACAGRAPGPEYGPLGRKEAPASSSMEMLRSFPRLPRV